MVMPSSSAEELIGRALKRDAPLWPETHLKDRVQDIRDPWSMKVEPDLVERFVLRGSLRTPVEACDDDVVVIP